MSEPTTSDAPRLSIIDRPALTGKARYDFEQLMLRRIKKTPRFLLRELFDYFRGRADCFPSNKRLAHVSGISPRNIRYLLKQLEAARILVCVTDLSLKSQRRIIIPDHPNAGKILACFGIAHRATGLRSLSYSEYLKTEHWQAVRAAALKRAGYVCSICSSNESLDVHHRTYERLGEEAPEDVITLCRSCHDLFHSNGRLARR